MWFFALVFQSILGDEPPEVAETAEQIALIRQVSFTSPSGELIEFEIRFDSRFKTNGGWMFDVSVTKDDKTTL